MASMQLAEEQKDLLLYIARKTIEAIITGKNIPDFKVDDSQLNELCGAFVTIHKNGNLRGCIGNIIGHSPLWETVRKMAAEASQNDPRFSPVTEDEFEKIDIEISVISPFEKIDDIEKINIGEHGIFVKHGYYQGLLLPQVATEYGWDRKEFIEHTCMKAGLHRDCYRNSKCEIFIFSATVFGEKNRSKKQEKNID
jgi:AmmeMemoRadiSam system protein A